MSKRLLTQLEELANNLWWSWDVEASLLWERVDPALWSEVHHNPVALLNRVAEVRLGQLERDPGFCADVANATARMDAYLSSDAWCAQASQALHSSTIAYLCMEYGLHESLRLYSGGLGVLAGDHLRSASDLGVPLVAVGLAYREGYFQQALHTGQQEARYDRFCFEQSPLQRLTDEKGAPRVVRVAVGARTVEAWVWRLLVGRVPLFLLDTDLEHAPESDRVLTRRLYSGGTHMRIEQEVLLGFGAVQALDMLGLTPNVWHLNEGHCAFSSLARLAASMTPSDTLERQLDAIRSRTLFTTHTPVPAGHDRFEPSLLEATLGAWRAAHGISPADLSGLGRVNPEDEQESFCMTVLALRTSAKTNGVSALHGGVSRSMWGDLYPDRNEQDVPIGHVTNGVHPAFWIAPPAQRLLDEVCPGWRDTPWLEHVWQPLAQVSDERIARMRQELKQGLLEQVHARTGVTLNPAHMTVGFARRFATYKRGDLLFRDPERLRALLDQGMQILYSGKAHPADVPGQAMIQTILEWCEHPWFQGRIVFLEDYDIDIGRHITSGSDVWLNNPIRPREASGTSGQKASLNGGLNLSTIDGWWPEGYDGTNGWTIGDTQERADREAQDAFDAEQLYQTLEGQVLPEWLDTGPDGISARWVERVRRSIQTSGPRFSSHRMVRDYALEWYVPLLNQ